MPFFDFSYEELQVYQPPRQEADDFDAFWQATLAEARQRPLDTRFEPLDAGLSLFETYDVTFNGFGGQPVRGWLILPRQRSGPLPVVVEYIGYQRGRGHVVDWLSFPAMGVASFVMDTRGQGGVQRPGSTGDDYGSTGPQVSGFMTRGIHDPAHYYYRRLFTDAVRAVDAAREHPAIDTERVAVTGRSQGGGIALATAGLHPDVSVCMPDVPFLCHYRRATEIIDTSPYNEIAIYLQTHHEQMEQVFTTLSYFDGVNFAPRAQANALFSVALMDRVCPPSTIFAAYNHYAGPKAINVYTYNGHEGGGSAHVMQQIRYLSDLWHLDSAA